MATWSRTPAAEKVVQARLNLAGIGMMGAAGIGVFAFFTLVVFAENPDDFNVVLFITMLVSLVGIYTAHVVYVIRKYRRLVVSGDVLLLDGQANAFINMGLGLIDAEAGRKRNWLFDQVQGLRKMQQTDGADSTVIARRMQELIAELNSMTYKSVPPPDDQPLQQ